MTSSSSEGRGLLHGDEHVLFLGFKDHLGEGGGLDGAGGQVLAELQGQGPSPLHLPLGQGPLPVGLADDLDKAFQPPHLGAAQGTDPLQGLLQVGEVLGLAQEGLLQLLLQVVQEGEPLLEEPGVGLPAQAVHQGP